MTVNQFPVVESPNDAQLVVIAGVTDAQGNVTPGYTGGGAGGGDASAANQTLQIAQETAINSKLAGTVNVAPLATIIPLPTIMQNGVSGNATGTSLNISGYAVAIIDIVANPVMSGGTVVNFEASVDDTTWVAILAHQVGVVGAIGINTSSNGDYRINVAGFKSLRARISGYSAGTVTIKGYVTAIAAQPTTVTTVQKASVSVDVTPTLVSGSYSTGQYVGASGTAMVIAGAANYAGGGGFFSVSAVDPASTGVSGELWIFDAAVVPPNDHVAFALSSADLAHILPGGGGVIPFSTWYATTAKSVSPCPIPLYSYKCAAGQTSLWACYVARGTYNPSAGAPTFRFTFWPD